MKATERFHHDYVWKLYFQAFFFAFLSHFDPDLAAQIDPDSVEFLATAVFSSSVPVTKAELNYTADVGEWPKRLWKTVPAELANGTVTARLPAERPLVCYLSITDRRDATVSTPHVELSDRTGK